MALLCNLIRDQPASSADDMASLGPKSTVLLIPVRLKLLFQILNSNCYFLLLTVNYTSFIIMSGKKLVNKRIRILWEPTWYNTTVTRYKRSRHFIEYDDNREEEWLDLDDVQFELELTAATGTPVSGTVTLLQHLSTHL